MIKHAVYPLMSHAQVWAAALGMLHYMWVTPLRNKLASIIIRNAHNAKEFVYIVDVPGVARRHIQLWFEHQNIMLRVEQRKSRRSGAYRFVIRALSLPVYSDAAQVTAHLEDGLLTLIIPRSDTPVMPRVKTIPIH